LIAGETDPAKLADLARKRLREKIPALKLALQGRVTEHHRFLLRMHLDHVTHLEALIGRLGTRIDEALVPFAEAAERLQTIPGVSQRVAETVIAEIGTNMEQFPRTATWRRGRGCARGITRAPASVAVVGRRRATAG
jgi:transposase